MFNINLFVRSQSGVVVNSDGSLFDIQTASMIVCTGQNESAVVFLVLRQFNNDARIAGNLFIERLRGS